MIDPTILVEREIALLGCHAFTDDDLAEIGRMLPSISPRLDAYIADEIALGDVPARGRAGEIANATRVRGACVGIEDLRFRRILVLETFRLHLAQERARAAGMEVHVVAGRADHDLAARG